MSFFFLWNKYAALHLLQCVDASQSPPYLSSELNPETEILCYPYFTPGLKVSHKKPVAKCGADSECLGRVIFFINPANAEMLLWQ